MHRHIKKAALALSLALLLSAPAASASPILRSGSHGHDVVLLQQKLSEIGYLRGSADGIFGSNSTDAVFRFQAANGLPEYGIVDADTYYALFSDLAVAGPEPTPTPLMTGAEGENVPQLQSKLAIWGFL